MVRCRAAVTAVSRLAGAYALEPLTFFDRGLMQWLEWAHLNAKGRKWSDLSGTIVGRQVGIQQKVAPHCRFLTAVTLGSSGDAQVSARFGGYSLSLSLSLSLSEQVTRTSGGLRK